MNIKDEVKSLIYKEGMTLRKVCQILSSQKNEKVMDNNITNKFRRNTIKFSEVQEILDIVGYHIEIIKNEQ